MPGTQHTLLNLTLCMDCPALLSWPQGKSASGLTESHYDILTSSYHLSSPKAFCFYLRYNVFIIVLQFKSLQLSLAPGSSTLPGTSLEIEYRTPPQHYRIRI